MKRVTINILAFFALLMSFSACSKYEEGPFLSFRTPEKRVVGLWELESVTVGNVNKTSDYLVDSVYLRFSITGDKDNMFIVLVEDNRTSPQLSMSSFSFSKDKENVFLFYQKMLCTDGDWLRFLLLFQLLKLM